MSEGARITESFLITGDIISSHFLGLKYWLVLSIERKYITELEPQDTNLSQPSLTFIGISKTYKIQRYYLWGEFSEGKKKVLKPVSNAFLYLFVLSVL